MEPKIAPEATAALFSPDAGTLIPYEYTIALAENAADNGVEVRTRRMVSSISKASGGGFEIKADHWEPRSYAAEAGLKAQPTGRKRDALKSLFTKDEAPAGLGNYFGAPPGEGGPWEKFPVLVKGEQKVGVAEMKVGGSGSMKAMDGVVVEKETIRAK